ncbi:S-adenosyl-L-methionine-dependent methyltransferase [Exidia glandulosa HHB12029]|uniref:S-adenosyl-L-methionine-dependent methyltransferase n=1 Tax=Exidia glandulosa HHB12029 TaxID=1314781 RepID=A0A165DQD6_EXIGL|nr:S-adenosyl-L-methionine-dependent methyltransferase [Exidia glandulosa HHB12029]
MASDDETSPSSFQPFSLPRRDRASLLATLPRLVIPSAKSPPTPQPPCAGPVEQSELSSARSASPAPSVVSYVPERDASRLLKAMYNRVFNATNDLYALPADETEFSRLDKQHLMHLIAIGGLYIAKDAVRRALAPEAGVQRRILDLGTGGGNWAIGMGQEFPDAEVVGVDLAPSTTRNPPPNVRFEFDDFGLGLPHFYGQFDVVHARSTANGVRNYEDFIAECVRCLRPGGVLLLVEGDMVIFDEDLRPHALAGDPLYPEDAGSWLARMLHEARNVMVQRGSSMGSGRKFRAFLGRRRDLVNAGFAEVFTNVGPWKRGPTDDVTAHYDMIGNLMRQNARQFVRSLRVLLLQHGFTEPQVEQFIAGTDRELEDLTLHMHTTWHYAWAEKDPTQSYSTPISR